MQLFDLLPESFFRPLTGKYRAVFADCLRLIYQAYRNELSFGVDKEVIVSALEDYFEHQMQSDLVFAPDDNEFELVGTDVIRDSRAKANAVLLRLKESGWLEYEQSFDYKIRVNLPDYAVTMMETFNRVIKNQELEYQSMVSQIHATLTNPDGLLKPYEYMLKRTAENTEELMVGLKKLNTNIRKYIDGLTNQRSAAEIVRDFFGYHKEIASKQYHRIKTSDNISYFRTTIMERLRFLLDDESLIAKALAGYMEVEQEPDQIVAEQHLRALVLQVMRAFRDYDEIVSEIDYKHAKYMSSAVSRAKFLLTNTNNAEGRIAQLLQRMAEQLNQQLSDEADDEWQALFRLQPQQHLDQESLYVVPVQRKMSTPELLPDDEQWLATERQRRRQEMLEKASTMLTRNNVNRYVEALLAERESVLASSLLASSLQTQTRRNCIRLIYIQLYGRDAKSRYQIHSTGTRVEIDHFQFVDFIIERKRGARENIH
jgi:hypothetical protein